MDAALPPLYRLALPRDLVAEDALPARDPVPELRTDDLLRLQALLRQLPSLYPVAMGAAPAPPPPPPPPSSSGRPPNARSVGRGGQLALAER
nr:probable G-protein coupled receptor 150 [Penaeus vannamei]